MLGTNRDRLQSFKVISGVTHYMGKEGAESEAGSLYVGSVLVAAVDGIEKRTLDGQRVRVILFKITRVPIAFLIVEDFRVRKR